MCDSASKTREGNRENSKKEDLINKNWKLVNMLRIAKILRWMTTNTHR